jgi:hypothetical protein
MLCGNFPAEVKSVAHVPPIMGLAYMGDKSVFSIVKYGEEPVPASMKSEIINNLPIMLDNNFWEQAQRNVTEENILAGGYKECWDKRTCEAGVCSACYCKDAK